MTNHPYRAILPGDPALTEPAVHPCVFCRARASIAKVRLRSIVVGSAVFGLLLLNLATAVLALSYQRLANKMLSAATALDDAAHPKKHKSHHDAASAGGARANLSAHARPPSPVRAPTMAAPPPPYSLAVFPPTGVPGTPPWSSATLLATRSALMRAKGIMELTSSEFVVDRSVIAQTIGNGASLVSSARIVPMSADGGARGFAVYGLRPDSLPGMLGLQNGDTIVTVNGWDLSTPDDALRAYPVLQNAREITVHLVRAGWPIDLRYHIR